MDIETLLTRLEAWAGYSTERDRDLADAVLRVAGWKSRENPRMEGGTEWYYKTGSITGSVAGTRRPHPIQNLQEALNQAPMHWWTWKASQDVHFRSWDWILTNGLVCTVGHSFNPAVACSLAVVRAYDFVRLNAEKEQP